MAEALAALRAANYVFAGPGSPTYALRAWAGTPIAGTLAEKLARGGAVSFASAAALTLGVATVPVYEVYKAGHDPAWHDGLDLLHAVTGLRAAVIPHYDNAEGGHHDTRFCYLGETRLRRLEAELPTDAFVLGVDEHTAAVFDLEAGVVRVEGNGGMTIRTDGRSEAVPAGSQVSFDELRSVAAGPGAARSRVNLRTAPAREPRAGAPATSLTAEAARLEARFAGALGRRDAREAASITIALEQALESWSSDTLTSDERDRARATLHAMVVRLGELAATGARDPREVVGPVVDVVLDARAAARAAEDWTASDRLRDGLAAAGVEVRDTAAGQEWHLLAAPPADPARGPSSGA